MSGISEGPPSVTSESAGPRQDAADDVSICYSEASHREASILSRINSLQLTSDASIDPGGLDAIPATSGVTGTKDKAAHQGCKKVMHVYAGSSTDSLCLLNVNDDGSPFYFDGILFQGRLVVRIRHFEGARPPYTAAKNTNNLTSEDYFGDKKRIFSIQFEGMFKEVADLFLHICTD
jgi:hypothetical protein